MTVYISKGKIIIITTNTEARKKLKYSRDELTDEFDNCRNAKIVKFRYPASIIPRKGPHLNNSNILPKNYFILSYLGLEYSDKSIKKKIKNSPLYILKPTI